MRQLQNTTIYCIRFGKSSSRRIFNRPDWCTSVDNSLLGKLHRYLAIQKIMVKRCIRLVGRRQQQLNYLAQNIGVFLLLAHEGRLLFLPTQKPSIKHLGFSKRFPPKLLKIPQSPPIFGSNSHLSATPNTQLQSSQLRY